MCKNDGKYIVNDKEKEKTKTLFAENISFEN